MTEQPETKNPGTARLKQAEEKLNAANGEFGRASDKIKRRIEVLSRIPAVAAFQDDMDAFALAIGAVQERLDEFVAALVAAAQEDRHGG